MKLIIDIPEKTYHMINAGQYDYGDMNLIIQHGTPLPKGHGGLIDVDYLREDFKTSKKISFAERMDISCIVDHAPIIIEADKESD